MHRAETAPPLPFALLTLLSMPSARPTLYTARPAYAARRVKRSCARDCQCFRSSESTAFATTAINGAVTNTCTQRVLTASIRTNVGQCSARHSPLCTVSRLSEGINNAHCARFSRFPTPPRPSMAATSRYAIDLSGGAEGDGRIYTCSGIQELPLYVYTAYKIEQVSCKKWTLGAGR